MLELDTRTIELRAASHVLNSARVHAFADMENVVRIFPSKSGEIDAASHVADVHLV